MKVYIVFCDNRKDKMKRSQGLQKIKDLYLAFQKKCPLVFLVLVLLDEVKTTWQRGFSCV